jgi:hypothetical protein
MFVGAEKREPTSAVSDRVGLQQLEHGLIVEHGLIDTYGTGIDLRA